MSYIIYDHISPSGKHYIGQTCRKAEERWGANGGRYMAKNAKGQYVHSLFANAILKYGWDNFKHEILFHNCSKELADTLEKAFIKYWKDLGLSYNLADGGSNGFETATMSALQESNKKKINQYTLSGKYLRTWDGIRSAARELNITRQGITSVLKGRKPSAFNYQWRYYTGSTDDIESVEHPLICQYTKQGDLVRIWNSVAEAGRVLNIDQSSISTVCRGTNPHRKTAGGYIWKFKDGIPVISKETE